ncbi:MAG: hypothetical protein DCC58_19250 [Chloroflexi bacterium]|nr:MAG: hypothetical protein DCC58_19250 [Chloroflexota bacterium]
MFVGAVPVVLSLFFGGAIVDRYANKHISIIGDAVSGISVMLIPLLYHTVGLAFWQLLVLVFLGALLDTPGQVARFSALPDLAALGGVSLERANALAQGALTVSSLLGPAAAGVLIALLGASNVLWIDAVTFGISLALVLTLMPASVRPPQRESAGYVAELLEGLRFVRFDRVLFPLVLFFAAMNIVIGPFDALIVPVYAKEVFDSAVSLGLMAAAIGAGVLAGTAVYGWLGPRLSRRTAFFLSSAIAPVILVALAATPGLPLALTLLAIMGVALGVSNILEYTIYFERIPDGMRARAMGITGAIGWGSVPVGRLLAGFLIDNLGLSGALLLLAALATPVVASMFVIPAFRDLGPPPENPQPAHT